MAQGWRGSVARRPRERGWCWRARCLRALVTVTSEPSWSTLAVTARLPRRDGHEHERSRGLSGDGRDPSRGRRLHRRHRRQPGLQPTRGRSRGHRSPQRRGSRGQVDQSGSHSGRQTQMGPIASSIASKPKLVTDVSADSNSGRHLPPRDSTISRAICEAEVLVERVPISFATRRRNSTGTGSAVSTVGASKLYLSAIADIRIAVRGFGPARMLPRAFVDSPALASGSRQQVGDPGCVEGFVSHLTEVKLDLGAVGFADFVGNFVKLRTSESSGTIERPEASKDLPSAENPARMPSKSTGGRALSVSANAVRRGPKSGYIRTLSASTRSGYIRTLSRPGARYSHREVRWGRHTTRPAREAPRIRSTQRRRTCGRRRCSEPGSQPPTTR